MQHATVTRTVRGLTALFLAAAAGFAWGTRDADGPAAAEDAQEAPADGPGAGERAFRQHCGGCHARADLAAGLREEGDLPAAAAGMLRFLESHGGASAEENAQIVGWLVSLARIGAYH